jgi:O-antigen/teichoic acid export membrane protein
MWLAFIPLYIKYLGIEAYGLIGLFTVLQAWLVLLDMGMSPTLSREMARFTGGHHSRQSIRDLLRTLEFITVGMAGLIAGGMALSANWIASSWLQAEALPVEVVAQAFAIMGLVTALRFAESIYRSSILGLQRQVLFSVVNSVLATVRGLGAVAILAWFSPTTQAFFLWQGLLSLITLGIFAGITYASLPQPERRAQFSRGALRSVWRFAGGMISITFLALLLTQVDKILLSKMLSLKEYGYYTLAAMVASAVLTMITPITQAFYPQMCELHARGDTNALAEAYHKGAQLVSVLAGSTAIVVIFFSETLLRLWTQDPELAVRTAPLLSLLMLGNLLNGLMWIPYQTQLAYGWTSLAVKINIAAVLVIVPAILWATPRYGAEGAACAWVVLNLSYLLIGIQFMYKRLLTSEKLYWYIHDILKPLSAVFTIVGSIALLWPYQYKNNLADIAMLGFAGLSSLFVGSMAANKLRSDLLKYFKIKYYKN